MKLKDKLILLALTLISVTWFSILIPWDLFPDPDALYHATMAKLTWERGFVDELSWLDLTVLGEHFADQHFLLHVIQSPIIAKFGITLGSRISSISLAVLAMLGIGIIFYKLKLKPFWLWPILLMFTQPFCSRLIQGKASPLAILLWLIFSAGTIWLLINRANRQHQNKKAKSLAYFVIFISGLLFALSHGGWILLIMTAILIILGSIVFDLAIGQQSIIASLKRSLWQSLLTVAFGIATGILLHTDRGDLLQFLWVQVVRIGVQTPTYLHMGMEWSSSSLTDIIGVLSVFGVIFLLSLIGLMMTPKKELPKHLMLPTIAWGFVCAALLALSIKSVRFAEYLQPALAIWIAMLAQFVNWQKFMSNFKIGNGKLSAYHFPALIIFCFIAILLNNAYGAFSSLRDSGIFKDDQYSTAMAAINKEAQKDDRIFHAAWDEFPILFSQNQNLKYISGLDPTFFYEASSTLAIAYDDLVFNTASSTKDQAYNLIHNRLQVKFIMLDTNRWKELTALIDSDPRYVKLVEADGEAGYRVEF